MTNHWIRTGILLCAVSALVLSACGIQPSVKSPLLQKTALELVDWNCPVLWVRIANYNGVPVTNARIAYEARADGLERKGSFTIKEVIPADAVRNFVNIRLGAVNPEYEKISLKLLEVQEIH